MGLEIIHLRKFLQIAYADIRVRRRLLRENIRNHVAKQNGVESSGGDFYGPFWTDAKNHIKKIRDLHDATEDRIAKNKARRRLYPELEKHFLQWWNENRRWRNEEFTIIGDPIKARFKVVEIGLTLKVENLVAVHVGGRFDRIVYPYFFEEPRLHAEACRIALWAMDKSLTKYDLNDMRILDVLGARAFGTIDFALVGNEKELLVRHFRSMQNEWTALWDEQN